MKDEFTRWDVDEWYDKMALEIQLANPDDFLKIKETLTRMGIASNKDRKIYQSCHILHKREKYYIVHFKELFAIDGKPVNITDEDVRRRNLIANLLAEWGLLKIVEPELVADRSAINSIKIVKYGEKDEWEFVAKYTIGNGR